MVKPFRSPRGPTPGPPSFSVQPFVISRDTQAPLQLPRSAETPARTGPSASPTSRPRPPLLGGAPPHGTSSPRLAQPRRSTREVIMEPMPPTPQDPADSAPASALHPRLGFRRQPPAPTTPGHSEPSTGCYPGRTPPGRCMGRSRSGRCSRRRTGCTTRTSRPWGRSCSRCCSTGWPTPTPNCSAGASTPAGGSQRARWGRRSGATGAIVRGTAAPLLAAGARVGGWRRPADRGHRWRCGPARRASWRSSCSPGCARGHAPGSSRAARSVCVGAAMGLAVIALRAILH